MNKVILILILFLISSFAHASTNYTEWILSHSKVKRGQALVIHGLNTKPEKMDQIIKELTENGYDVYSLKLSGHNHDLDRMKKVTYEGWRDEVKSAYDVVQAKNKKDGGKLTLAAYSLGGALAMDMLANNPGLKVDQSILFAPAIEVKATSHLIKFFELFGKDYIVPSFCPEDFRAERGTSVAAYLALFKAIDHLHKGDLKLLNIPTLVFIDKKDELVSIIKPKSL
jgi:esterase/lipase